MVLNKAVLIRQLENKMKFYCFHLILGIIVSVGESMSCVIVASEFIEKKKCLQSLSLMHMCIQFLDI